MAQTETTTQVLVDTQWVADHLNDKGVRLLEVDVDSSAYDQGHIQNAVGWNWETQLQDNVRRDIISKEKFEELCSKSGVANDTTVVLYGDNNNWFAAWAFWQFKIHGHPDVRIMNGGRRKWVDEGRELTTDKAQVAAAQYQAGAPNFSIRAFRADVEKTIDNPKYALVDVRSPKEFTGEIIAPPGMSETAQRAGHVPGARNIPWGQACNDDGTFKSVEDLQKLYGGQGITPDKEVIAYCRIGERSSHTWFVLRHLLGYPNVRNYDGSWTEWGNLVGAPVEKNV